MTVSIIIPIYNVAPYIEACLNSVYNQTYPDIEVVLVNDCTPDNSIDVAAPVIQKLQTKYSVQLVEHACNSGLSAARNSGVRASSGTWLYFLDSDDEITPDCIQTLMHLTVRYPGVDFTLGGFDVRGSDMRFEVLSLEYLSSNEAVFNDFLQAKWYVMACNKLVRKDFFVSRNLWFEEGIVHEDELFSFYLAVCAHSMACTSHQTYIYKIRQSGSITSNRGAYKSLKAKQKIVSSMVSYIHSYLPTDYKLPVWALVVQFAYSLWLECYMAYIHIEPSEKSQVIASISKDMKTVRPYKTSAPWTFKIKRILIMSLPVWLGGVLIRLHASWIKRRSLH